MVVAEPNSYYVPSGPDDTSYLKYREDKLGCRRVADKPVCDEDPRPAVVYVGANDGMLNGFDAATGEERLAYVPGMLHKNLRELGAPDYDHRYRIDGSPNALDVKISGVWHTVLVSGLGHGGRGLFALDVSSPETFGENNADSIALFEYGPSHEAALFADQGDHLGHLEDRINLVQLETGDFAAVFANGYNSPSGKAALYVINLDGAADGTIEAADVLRSVPANEANAGLNGMTSVSLVDSDGNGRVDIGYGGTFRATCGVSTCLTPTISRAPSCSGPPTRTATLR